jgi:hypothetical protein
MKRLRKEGVESENGKMAVTSTGCASLLISPRPFSRERRRGYMEKRPSLRRRNPLIPLTSGILSIGLGIGVLTYPAYADEDKHPAELPEVVGDQSPSPLDQPLLSPFLKKDHEKGYKQKSEEKPGQDPDQRQDQKQPVLELPEQPLLPQPTEEPRPSQPEKKGTPVSVQPDSGKQGEPKQNKPVSVIPVTSNQHHGFKHNLKNKPTHGQVQPEAAKQNKPVSAVLMTSSQPVAFSYKPTHQRPTELPESQVSVSTEKSTVQPKNDSFVLVATASGTSKQNKPQRVTRTENGNLPKTASAMPNGVAAGMLFVLGGAFIHRYYRIKHEG